MSDMGHAATMATAPKSDERDREIAELKAEVRRLESALKATRARADASDEPLFGHGLRGGFLGGLETVIATFAMLILLVVVRHLTATQ
jgi:hypothetical protein